MYNVGGVVMKEKFDCIECEIISIDLNYIVCYSCSWDVTCSSLDCNDD